MKWWGSFRHRGSIGASPLDALTKLGGTRFNANLTAAELQVLSDSASAEDLPSPDPDALRPEGPYDPHTPRPEVRAAFLRWLAVDPQAQAYIDAKGIRVYSSTIAGDLDLRHVAKLPSLDFRRCTVRGRLLLESSATGVLHISDCLLEKGIEGDVVEVLGPVYLQRTESQGEVRFLHAHIHSNFECRGTKLNVAGDALSLDGAQIDGDAFFDAGFECSGEIRLLGADIHGSVSFAGAHLSRSVDDALTMDKVHIGGNLLLNGGMSCAAKIRLPNCRIDGDLNFMGAEVQMAYCDNMNLSGDLMWLGIQKTPETFLHLTRARVKAFRDDRESWPERGNVRLDGLVYENIIAHAVPSAQQIMDGERSSELPFHLSSRIEWLAHQDHPACLRPQPWAQMGKFLESNNDKSGAKRVLFRFRCVQAGNSVWPIRLLRVGVAFLERSPGWILVPTALIVILGSLIFAWAGPDRSGALITTARDKDGHPLTGQVLARYPKFQPIFYTLENALPLVKLGFDDKWTPDPEHVARSPIPGVAWPAAINSYWFLTIARMVIIFLGWFQAALLGAVLTSRFKP
jgi:hypothetical protein